MMKAGQNRINIALAQTNIVWEDKDKNLQRAEGCIKHAAGQGAEAVFFPEMSFTGFSMNTGLTGESDYRTADIVCRLARGYRISVGFGWVKDCGEKAENHYTVADKTGAVISDYAKIHPFSYSGEDRKFKGGEKLGFFELNGITFSSFICYDLRFPEIFQAASKRADAIIVPANWPAKRREHWGTLLRARAIENQVYVLAVNCVGETGGVEYAGDSMVINPNGDIQAFTSLREDMLYYSLADDTGAFRAAFPTKADRREELYSRISSSGNSYSCLNAGR